MKRFVVIGASLVVALGLAGTGAARQASTCSSCAIEVQDNAFNPLDGTVGELGAKVEWSVVGTMDHKIHQVEGVFVSPVLHGGGFYDRVMSAGYWRYDDPVQKIQGGHFSVAPELEYATSLHHSVVATWAVPGTNTGSFFRGHWMINGVHFNVTINPTHKRSARVARGDVLTDGKGHKHRLEKGDCVEIWIASGVNTHKTGASGWSALAKGSHCLKLK